MFITSYKYNQFMKGGAILLMLGIMATFTNCNGGDEGTLPPVEPSKPLITIDPSIQYQEMLGFGGAITWFSDRLTTRISNR